MADQREGGIEWCDTTWNPIVGCRRVSAGCDHCWALRMAHRFSGRAGPYAGLTRLTRDGPEWGGETRLVPAALSAPFRWRTPRRVAVALMGDLWLAERDEVGAVCGVMAAARRHTYLTLTKRPEWTLVWLAHANGWGPGRAWDWCRVKMLHQLTPPRDEYGPMLSTPWPLPHVWLGFSAEDQATFDGRWTFAQQWQTQGWHTWVSLEPLLGPVMLPHAGPEWVVVGGESGAGARPMHPEWVRSLRDQCARSGTPFVFKQWGEWAPHRPPGSRPPELASFTDGCVVGRIGKKAAGNMLDGRQHLEDPGRQEANRE